MVVMLLCLLFFKQKTAYEMRISDWSSDVCSSDLDNDVGRNRLRHRSEKDGEVGHAQRRLVADNLAPDQLVAALDGAPDVPALGRDRLVTPVVAAAALDIEIAHHLLVACRRPDERRVGKECVSPYRSRWPTVH